jgi:S1-C subfamily serine protease
MKTDIDMAIFDLVTTKKYDVMVLGNDSDLQIGDKTINPNFAAGLSKQLSHGVISSDLLSMSEHCNEDCAGYFLVQSYGAGGASGSAIISEKTHEVIGLAIWQAPGDNIGLGIEPISKFAAFLAGPNQPHPDDDDGEVD